MKRYTVLTFVAGTLAVTVLARAEQGGGAHYLPGSMASFIDGFPGKAGGIAVLDYFTYYQAGAGAGRQLPFNGLLTTEVDATVYADTLAAFYQAPWEVLGGGLAFGIALPCVWLEVEGQAQRVGPGGVVDPIVRSLRDTASGIGDLTLYPLMLGWTNLVKDLKLDTRLGIYAPTGDYEQGQLANVGKNYWTFEPGLLASWLSSRLGTEITLYAGVDFNTANEDAGYTSGTSLHLDATVAQHLPLGKGFIGVGANAFYYQQITGDSGDGALLGEFEGMTYGVGPVISYMRQFGSTQFLAEFKWLPELDTNHRMKGDYLWFKFGVLF